MLKIQPVLKHYGIYFLLILGETKPNISGYLANKRSAFANTDAEVGIHNDIICCQSELFPLPKAKPIFKSMFGEECLDSGSWLSQQVMFVNRFHAF